MMCDWPRQANAHKVGGRASKMDKPLQILNSYMTLIQLIQAAFVVVGLIYVAAQTRLLGRQVKLSNISTQSAYFKDIDELVFKDEKARNLSGDSRAESLGYLYLGLVKARFLLHKERLMDDDTWASDVESMVRAFARGPFLFDVWA